LTSGLESNKIISKPKKKKEPIPFEEVEGFVGDVSSQRTVQLVD
jgi:hypothetical protein